jgi:hypothetical protein
MYNLVDDLFMERGRLDRPDNVQKALTYRVAFSQLKMDV